MKKKKWVIPIVIIAVIIMLWFTGIIPKQIARISGTSYVNNHFPEMQLKCVGVEYADVYGDYLITFKGADENTYSCVIGPKYFPVSMGQGLFAIESDYAENCKNKMVYGKTQEPSDNDIIHSEGEVLDPVE